MIEEDKKLYKRPIFLSYYNLVFDISVIKKKGFSEFLKIPPLTRIIVKPRATDSVWITIETKKNL